ncbi:MAG: LPXTG cell wall anchor domain-containing protein [Clostridia bacterium]|nr:LPXTG cell wall anchor domain-containing protein [Clostridia bacterium]
MTGTAVVGAYTNIATVTGNPPDGQPVSDTDSASYTGYTPAADDDDDDDDDEGGDGGGTTTTLVVESAVLPTLEVHAGEIPQTGDNGNVPFAAGGLLFLLFSGLGLYGWLRKEQKEV